MELCSFIILIEEYDLWFNYLNDLFYFESTRFPSHYTLMYAEGSGYNLHSYDTLQVTNMWVFKVNSNFFRRFWNIGKYESCTSSLLCDFCDTVIMTVQTATSVAASCENGLLLHLQIFLPAKVKHRRKFIHSEHTYSMKTPKHIWLKMLPHHLHYTSIITN